MPEFKPFNYGQAVQQGQGNALRSVQLGEAVRQVRGRNALSNLASNNVTGANKYNALNQMGRPDLAQAEQVKDLQMQSAQLKYVADSSRRVFDQGSYETWINDMEANGLAAPGELQSRLGTDYNLKTQLAIKQMRGEAKGALSKLTLNRPGGMAVDYLQQDGAIVHEGQPYSRWTDAQRSGTPKDHTPATINQAKLEQAKDALAGLDISGDKDDAYVAWINAFEREFRNHADTNYASYVATKEIEQALKTEQGVLYGANEKYAPEEMHAPLSEEEQAELKMLEEKYGQK